MEQQKREKSLTQKLKTLGIVISVPTIIGAVVFLFKQQLDIKNSEIERMGIFQVDNVSTMFDAQKKLYQSQLEQLQQKIKELESSGENASNELNTYRHQVIELQTKINIIKDISIEVVRAAETKFGPLLKLNEVVPFSFYRIPQNLNDEFDSLFEIAMVQYKKEFWEWNYAYFYYPDNLSFSRRIYVRPKLDSIENYPILKGIHSPMFYSFDSVDLRTATFRNSNLSGVDLSNAIFDSKTKLPKGVQFSSNQK